MPPKIMNIISLSVVLIIVIISIVFVYTHHNDEPLIPATIQENEKIIKVYDGIYINVYQVIIDGNEYYATKSNFGRWQLCPKLPPKN